jgi:hypothetical protein
VTCPVKHWLSALNPTKPNPAPAAERREIVSDREVLERAAEICLRKGWPTNAYFLKRRSEDSCEPDPLQPPGKEVRIAVAIVDNARVGVCWISDQTPESSCLEYARDDAVGEGWGHRPVTHQGILVGILPPISIPEIAGRIEVAHNPDAVTATANNIEINGRRYDATAVIVPAERRVKHA